MKTIKHKYVVALILMLFLLFSSTVIYYRHKVASLKKELFDKQVEHILEVDRLVSEILHAKTREIDSLILIERLRYNSLMNDYNKTKKNYEKISTDYSSIVIDRPEF